MYFFFTKVVQELLWPLNWAMGGLAAALALLSKGRERAARGAMIFALASLLVPSFPFVARWLRRPLENAYPSRPIADYPTADAIVVLGGSVSGRLPPRHEPEEIAGSRLLPAARLYRLKKAPIVVASSGYLYDDESSGMRADADDMKEILVAMGIPAEAIVTERESRTTRENAQATARLLRERGGKRVLLVTTAFHIRRAVEWFRKESLDVVPVPVAREAVGHGWGINDILPSAAALANSTVSLKEYYGWLAALVHLTQ